MKRLLISLSFSLLLVNLSIAQDLKDKNSAKDDMYGEKSRYKNKKTHSDNYDAGKYESSKSRKTEGTADKKNEVYDYSPSSVEEHKNPTWMAWETNTARNVDTSIIRQYYNKRSTATMINLYKVDSSSIVWHDYKAEKKQARRNYRLQKMAIRRSGGYYNNRYYAGYGYGYGGARPYYGGGYGNYYGGGYGNGFGPYGGGYGYGAGYYGNGFGFSIGNSWGNRNGFGRGYYGNSYNHGSAHHNNGGYHTPRLRYR